MSSIYDIAGSQRTATNQTNADSFAGIKQYASMIETEDQAGIISYPRATKIPSSIQDNAIDSNGIPYVSKEKLLYPSVDFFTIFHLPDGHRINSISPTITLDRQ